MFPLKLLFHPSAKCTACRSAMKSYERGPITKWYTHLKHDFEGGARECVCVRARECAKQAACFCGVNFTDDTAMRKCQKVGHVSCPSTFSSCHLIEHKAASISPMAYHNIPFSHSVQQTNHTYISTPLLLLPMTFIPPPG